MRQDIRPVVAASVAVFRGPQVLLARRGRGAGVGLWSLPGGKVEAGETVAEAAVRELREEVGVEARILAVAGVRDIMLRDEAGRLDAHYVVIAHAAVWVTGEPCLSDEAPEAGWFLPGEISGLPARSGFGTTPGLADMVALAWGVACAQGCA